MAKRRQAQAALARRYRGALGRLRRFCRRQGITLRLVKGLKIAEYNDGIVEDVKEILVGYSWPVHRKVHAILHELGHASITEVEVKHRWSIQVIPKDPTKLQLLTEMDEEFEAWFRARLIAARLGITLDEELFNEDKIDGLESYIDNYVFKAWTEGVVEEPAKSEVQLAREAGYRG